MIFYCLVVNTPLPDQDVLMKSVYSGSTTTSNPTQSGLTTSSSSQNGLTTSSSTQSTTSSSTQSGIAPNSQTPIGLNSKFPIQNGITTEFLTQYAWETEVHLLHLN